ncbi:MAG: cupin domain-containing protein [Reyranellales bacterium]|jgi:mannose-6-phosphate isomerase-like protein (cupin superfamily)
MMNVEATVETYDLSATYLHLGVTEQATPLPVGPDFWANMPPILSSGRMVSLFKHDADWGVWERHPVGDEIIIQLTGRMRLRLELPNGEIAVDLSAGRYVIVPRNIWHTADISAPSSAIFITEGHGTENRPRSA